MVREMLMAGPWALPLHIVTGIAAVTAIAALWTRHFHLARVAAAAQVTFILWGWAAAQYPYLLPPTLTIEAAAAPSARWCSFSGRSRQARACSFRRSTISFAIFKMQRRS